MKVSVILTTYNSSKNLETSLPALFAQEGIGTDFELEVIAVDNRSTDNTCDILKSYGIQYHVNDHNTGGPNKGRNKGLELASGDAICFLDDDDAWHPSKTIRQLQALREAPIVTSGYVTVSRVNGRRSVRGVSHDKTTFFPENVTFLSKLIRSPEKQNSYMSTIMISKDLRHIRFEEHFGMLDFDWLLKLFENRPSIQINESLVTRFVHEQNISRTEAFRRIDYYFTQLVYEDYRKRHPKWCSIGLKRLHGTRARYYYEMGQMAEARRFLIKASLDLKNTLYYLSSFAGSNWVKSRYRVFG